MKPCGRSDDYADYDDHDDDNKAMRMTGMMTMIMMMMTGMVMMRIYMARRCSAWAPFLSLSRERKSGRGDKLHDAAHVRGES